MKLLRAYTARMGEDSLDAVTWEKLDIQLVGDAQAFFTESIIFWGERLRTQRQVISVVLGEGVNSADN